MRLTAFLVAALFGASGTVCAQDSGWDWTIAPYLWAADVNLDMTINDDTSIGGGADFADILDKLDSSFMGHLEARKGHWGLFFDTIYMDLSDSNQVSVGPGGPILGDLTADTGMTLKLYDAGGIYRFAEPGEQVQFDLLGGLRYLDVDVDALLTLPGPAMNTIDISTGPSETDLMVGARLISRFADRWHWGIRGDTSFGGTEGTINGVATVGYTFGQSGLFSLTAGYRYMKVKMDGTTARGNMTTTDMKFSGPLVGFVFTF
jgi:hypothetical protein